MRQIPGVPLIYLHGNAPTLERPSAMTESLTERIADGKTELSQHQRQIIAALKEQTFGPTEEKDKKKKKRRGPKGPNPLSCKKKKKIIVFRCICISNNFFIHLFQVLNVF